MRSLWRGLLLVLCMLALWSFGFEPGWLQERHLEVSTEQWLGRPLRIAIASDLHVGAPHASLDMLRRVVAQLNESTPDLILLPGDFVIQDVWGGKFVDPQTIADELAALKAPLGVFAVLGNHDWWHDGGEVAKALESRGIRVLENEAVPLTVGEETLWLVGVGDDMTGHAHPREAFAQVPPDAKTIVMMHDPGTLPDLPRKALFAVAGHTHGGQIRLPGYGALILPGRAPREHAYGWIVSANNSRTPTYVTSGVGTSILPVRFNCPPETLLVRLTGA